MLSNSQPASSNARNDPIVSYSQALHDYTLHLWTESRRMAEEKARCRAARKEDAARRRKEIETSDSPETLNSHHT
ncbi:hypothetical protein EV363DRAFT_1207104 [Boletus edulis]|uniref:Uncharacterized protein n=1 Tax=Boletus edulis BED1 TaxID=1328754 RepID=A0AAD4GHM8_BOLED|nr:hypothetical protein EV363DRAFT_1207104 [Boletus edulis]KAF8445711.1 hypothetical protein L210DRAFT_936413 [Boletus edulis BED1]